MEESDKIFKLGFVLLALFLHSIHPGAASAFQVTSTDCAVVLPAQTNAIINTAAQELRKHLSLISGSEIPIKTADQQQPADCYLFHIGVPEPGDSSVLLEEEARWSVGPDAAYLYGHEAGLSLLYAVYGFLEEQLGVRWIMPGDNGIAYEKQSVLNLVPGARTFRPELRQRQMRSGVQVRPLPPKPANASAADEEARHNLETRNAYATDMLEWQRRMRLGNRGGTVYGHAFGNWWERYSKTNPEYFALNKYGKREPERIVEPKEASPVFTAKERGNVKLCVSNPGVTKQIVDNWVAAGSRGDWINTCENDLGWGFCRCDACVELDARKPEEAFNDHLSDRYVYLANAVTREARARGYKVGAALYAYNQTEHPPRRLKLEPGQFVGVVPTTLDLDETRALFEGWRTAGAPVLLSRPNLTRYYQTTALPIGTEKQFFETFQIAYKCGTIGADYDRLMCQWTFHGLSDYALARSFSEPDKPFEYWEDHYCAAFGPAAPEVKAFFAYWRNEVWEKRLRPNLKEITERGKWFNFARGLVWSSLDLYYRPEDFDHTDALLKLAAPKAKTDFQREQILSLTLANRHARLVFNAIAAQGEDKFAHALDLLEFRRKHPDDFGMAMPMVTALEAKAGDVTGVVTAENLKKYPLPWKITDLHWRFRLDPEDRGATEKWQGQPWDEKLKWSALRTDYSWKAPHEPPPDIAQTLRTYEGIGWYATQIEVPEAMQGREVYLYFGAVDNSCWVYVNGQLAGEHLFTKPDDWSTPFEIRIDPFLAVEDGKQEITVRVRNKGGSGGIWRRVWLVSKHQPK
ncbi:MAG: DUF4838 domain-containing protein [Gammaproteobacteria bacterium]